MSLQQHILPMILALDKNPLDSIKNIAVELDISWPTAKKRFQQALDEKIIFSVVGHPDHKKLSLKRHFILAKIKDYRELKLLEDICDLHPYTSYRTRIIGSEGVSLFMIFQVPDTNAGDNNIKDFFQILYREKVILDYHLYTSRGIGVQSSFDLQRYNHETSAWEFDTDTWISNLSSYSSGVTFEIQDPIDLRELDKRSLFVLRMMTHNMLPSQKELKEKYEEEMGPISKSEFNRRYNFVKKELINSTELFYDTSLFNISENYLYILSELSNLEISQFYALLQDKSLPFKCSVELVGQNNLLFWGSLPPRIARELSYQIWKRFPQAKTYNYSTQRGWTMKYWFYHENFDEDIKRWKDDFAYMVEHPLVLIKDRDKN